MKMIREKKQPATLETVVDELVAPHKFSKSSVRSLSIRTVKVVAPSTSANLGPGFDVFGLAHNAFQDTIEIEVTSHARRRVTVEVTGVDQHSISCEPSKNTAGLVAKHVAERLPSGYGLLIHVKKGIPVGKGLGSSGASAAACIFGLNRIMDLNLSNDQLIQLAAKGENASAGSPHADNVAASILGGFTIVQSYRPFCAIHLSPPKNLRIALAVPEVLASEKKTRKARAILPRSIAMNKVIHNIGHASSMVAGMVSGDIGLIGRGMVDVVAEPLRAKSLPCYAKVRKNALAAGAAGVAISGSGPTIMAIVDERLTHAINVAKTMKEDFEASGIECRALSCKPTSGVRFVKDG